MGPTPCKPRPAIFFVSIFKLLGVQFSGLKAVRALRPEEQGSAALEPMRILQNGQLRQKIGQQSGEGLNRDVAASGLWDRARYREIRGALLSASHLAAARPLKGLIVHLLRVPG